MRDVAFGGWLWLRHAAGHRIMVRAPNVDTVEERSPDLKQRADGDAYETHDDQQTTVTLVSGLEIPCKDSISDLCVDIASAEAEHYRAHVSYQAWARARTGMACWGEAEEEAGDLEEADELGAPDDAEG